MALNALEIKELEEIEVTEGVEQTDRFKITDIGGATWALRKLSALHKQVQQVEELAAAERFRIDTWEKAEKDKLQKSIDFFESLLKEYYADLKAQDPRARITTPYGSVSTRRQTKWHYDETRTLEWLKANNYQEFIRVKESLDKTRLKKSVKVAGSVVIDQHGEVVPGVTVEVVENVVIKPEV